MPALKGHTVLEMLPFSAGEDARIRNSEKYFRTGTNKPNALPIRHVPSAARLALLAEVELQLRSRLRWLYGQHDDLVAVATEHVGLAEAVRAGDVGALPFLVSTHLATGHRLAVERRRRADVPG